MASFIEFIQKEIWHVAPILAVGGFGVAIIIERFIALFLVYPIRSSFFERVRDLVMAGRVNDAVALCEKYKSKPCAHVAREALKRAHQPESLIEHGLALAVAEMNAKIQKRTPFLSTIANVATLLGLFGTIAGLIASFAALQNVDPQQKSAMLAAGISTAMNATMLGLAVAIPAMMAFAILINKTNKLVGEVDQAAVRTLDIIQQRVFSLESDSGHRPTGGSNPPVPPGRRVA